MKLDQYKLFYTGKCKNRFGGIQAYCRPTGSGGYWCYYYIEKNAICLKDYRLQSFVSIQYVYGDLCKHLGIDLSTDHPDRYSNLFLNAYINRHAHTEYLKMV